MAGTRNETELASRKFQNVARGLGLVTDGRKLEDRFTEDYRMGNVKAETKGLGAHLAQHPCVAVLGVKYLHLRMEDGTDLYVTEHGLPFTKCLLPLNHWEDKQWFDEHSVRLPGSSNVYRVTTKEIDGQSKDIVIKWNRMGQDIPGETAEGVLDGAEFNSPFMEFSLLQEMRSARHDSACQIYTHKPLAIYVPRKFVKAEQLGRRSWRMKAIQRTHHEIPLDWNRNYAVIYEWLKGIDATEAYSARIVDHDGMVSLYDRANCELRDTGFCIRDNKVAHIIIRPRPDGALAKGRSGSVLYGLVDFELLERTPEREEMIRAAKRHDYLIRQAHRFETRDEFPPELTPVTIMGVEYIFGQVESTGGALWVVGKDPLLFDYFLPEKWRRTPRTKLAGPGLYYKTTTKDNVHLVWRVSRVGERPDVDPFVRSEQRVLTYGYNSPFEEFSIAMELSRKGIDTKYPRAIYMTGHHSTAAPSLSDPSRYKSHARLQTPDGDPILLEDREYMTIWGYWNAPDDMLAVKDEAIYQGLDALSAYREGRLTQKAYLLVMRTTKKRLTEAGIEDLSLSGSHLLLSIDKSDRLATDEEGMPLVRIRNFELLRRIAAAREISTHSAQHRSTCLESQPRL
jgi:hypothetical protein